MIQNSYFISYLRFINFKNSLQHESLNLFQIKPNTISCLCLEMFTHSFIYFTHRPCIDGIIWVRGAELRELKNDVRLGIGVNSEKNKQLWPVCQCS